MGAGPFGGQKPVCLRCGSPELRSPTASEGLIPGGHSILWTCDACGFVGTPLLVAPEGVRWAPEPIYDLPPQEVPPAPRPSGDEEVEAPDAAVESVRAAGDRAPPGRWRVWLLRGSVAALILVMLYVVLRFLGSVLRLRD